MKHVGHELDKILTERKFKKKEFASKLGMSAVNLSKIINKESVDALLLEKIAKNLNIPVSYFFEEGQGNAVSISSTKSNDIEQLQKEIENLKEQLSLKNQIIELLKK